MAISSEEIGDIAQRAANKVMEGQETCVSAGMLFLREHDSFKKATAVIFRVNLKGLVSVDDLKIPHSELAIHVDAAGKDIIALALTGSHSGMATYDKGEGACGHIIGSEGEVFSPRLLEKVKQMWEKRGPD